MAEELMNSWRNSAFDSEASDFFWSSLGREAFHVVQSFIDEERLLNLNWISITAPRPLVYGSTDLLFQLVAILQHLKLACKLGHVEFLYER